MLRKVAAHFPKAEVVEIPDAGHLVLEDAPEFEHRNHFEVKLSQIDS